MHHATDDDPWELSRLFLVNPLKPELDNASAGKRCLHIEKLQMPPLNRAAFFIYSGKFSCCTAHTVQHPLA